MSGETDLNKLIASMRPELRDGTYVFVTMPFDGADPVGLGAVMSFREAEGVTMIVPDQAASTAGLVGVFPCRMVTPSVSLRRSRIKYDRTLQAYLPLPLLIITNQQLDPDIQIKESWHNPKHKLYGTIVMRGNIPYRHHRSTKKWKLGLITWNS
jgi:hypothetical protein